MTSPQGCDGCHDEIDLFSVGNRQTGQAQFLGPLCLAMMGITMLVGTDSETSDAVFKEFGYQPTKATKDARKESEVPEVDPARTIVEVVESAPTPPGEHDDDQAAASPAVELVDRVIDKVRAEESEQSDGLPEMRAELAEAGPPADVDDPAPY